MHELGMSGAWEQYLKWWQIDNLKNPLCAEKETVISDDKEEKLIQHLYVCTSLIDDGLMRIYMCYTCE